MPHKQVLLLFCPLLRILSSAFIPGRSCQYALISCFSRTSPFLYPQDQNPPGTSLGGGQLVYFSAQQIRTRASGKSPSVRNTTSCGLRRYVVLSGLPFRIRFYRKAQRLRHSIPIAHGLLPREQEFSPFAVVRPRLSPYRNGGPQLVQSQGRTSGGRQRGRGTTAVPWTRSRQGHVPHLRASRLSLRTFDVKDDDIFAGRLVPVGRMALAGGLAVTEVPAP